jgi:ketosteroid isomerase-like protein
MSVTIEQLKQFAQAWNDHDINALMRFMHPDCAFETWMGPLVCGTRYSGYEDVRKGYSKAWQDFPDAKWSHDKHFVSGDRGLSEWIFTGTHVNGQSVEVLGCDVFTFKDGKILLKNSFRKNRLPA